MWCLSTIRPCEQQADRFALQSDQAYVLHNVRGRQQPLQTGSIAELLYDKYEWVSNDNNREAFAELRVKASRDLWFDQKKH